MRRIVIVSNRVAPVNEAASKGATGGLAVAILETLRESNGLWFGWSGNVHEAPVDTPKHSAPTQANPFDTVTVDLTPAEHSGYYNGYANRILWPILHYRSDLMEYHSEHFRTYQRVNANFVSQLVPLLREDDLIWLHDYHLMMAPRDLRQAGVKNRIGFFLHTPFPSADVFATLPNHRELIASLCHCDLIGFQSPTDLRSFEDYITHEAGGQVHANEEFEAFGRQFRAQVFPISIDPDSFAGAARESSRSNIANRLRESLDGRALMVGVDRLDYSKGLPERFLSFEHLLDRYPENRRRVTFLQIAPYSRSEVPEYKLIRSRLEGLSGRINGRFAEVDWTPLRYINRGLARKTLAGVLRHSRVAVVTPLRDGMNLVAKEYIAAQDPEDPGVLVLSRFAGAAHELKEALIVNPLDYENTGEALQRALSMSLEERKERWSAMMETIRQQDITTWRKSFIAALEAG
ncbi:MAG: alpha,alpha-trehalose-phosphate synthase (UDP-forming) [Pseudomonadota bacterium]|uniref:alpha,alpha-trehalose-phosphate synthase (UDP-forming) n=1 Tax=Fodinicurvata fenggangensis TaxID=1121830 RepID=UPI00047BC465|nr:alpha,alpha-trehalose-phosphate synthase (UDP-forming) [Fodinicurvata fenggangensis]